MDVKLKEGSDKAVEYRANSDFSDAPEVKSIAIALRFKTPESEFALLHIIVLILLCIYFSSAHPLSWFIPHSMGIEATDVKQPAHSLLIHGMCFNTVAASFVRVFNEAKEINKTLRAAGASPVKSKIGSNPLSITGEKIETTGEEVVDAEETVGKAKLDADMEESAVALAALRVTPKDDDVEPDE